MRSFFALLLGIALLTAAATRASASDTKFDRQHGSQLVGLFSLSSGKPVEPTDREVRANPKNKLGPGPVILTQNEEVQILDGQLLQAPAAATDTIPAETATLDPSATRLFESTWYTRIDYFQWQEWVDGDLFMLNEGVAPTVGWQQRRGQQRYRFDVFGTRADYSASMADGILNSVTDYLGLRGEYELLWEPAKAPYYTVFAGVGTRFFVRSMPDVIFHNKLIVGYQEAWWTFYPYVGYETRRTLKPNAELYCSLRAGMTAFTREHITRNDVTLFPRPGLILLPELGVRGPRLSAAFYGELMGWSVSPKVLNYYDDGLYYIRQPESTMLTLGARLAWSY